MQSTENIFNNSKIGQTQLSFVYGHNEEICSVEKRNVRRMESKEHVNTRENHLHIRNVWTSIISMIFKSIASMEQFSLQNCTIVDNYFCSHIFIQCNVVPLSLAFTHRYQSISWLNAKCMNLIWPKMCSCMNFPCFVYFFSLLFEPMQPLYTHRYAYADVMRMWKDKYKFVSK